METLQACGGDYGGLSQTGDPHFPDNKDPAPSKLASSRLMATGAGLGSGGLGV